MTQKTDNSKSLIDYKINLKIKVASLWTALMFLYIYADYFRLMTPNKLEKMINLQTPMGTTTPKLLVIFSVLLIIPALMIFLSIFLKPQLNKWLNIIISSLYAIISILIIISSFGNEWQMFFVLFNIIELMLLILIMTLAWKWPRYNNL
ncbi:hypothetical protein DI487_02755 [Flavobacterium sediminis]|uniref:Uncharacterized protein n=1 Tax=Flavobacterium sediminis TaxID=2201181 RepID=A0A2U8QRV6_9FLAO|nr:DUF6326 family protein [Flavobacterium sediminis]AWM12893.1 hypothetical protein DI487_02755 [Flavobacterium sediminis]